MWIACELNILSKQASVSSLSEHDMRLTLRNTCVSYAWLSISMNMTLSLFIRWCLFTFRGFVVAIKVSISIFVSLHEVKSFGGFMILIVLWISDIGFSVDDFCITITVYFEYIRECHRGIAFSWGFEMMTHIENNISEIQEHSIGN